MYLNNRSSPLPYSPPLEVTALIFLSLQDSLETLPALAQAFVRSAVLTQHLARHLRLGLFPPPCPTCFVLLAPQRAERALL